MDDTGIVVINATYFSEIYDYILGLELVITLGTLQFPVFVVIRPLDSNYPATALSYEDYRLYYPA